MDSFTETDPDPDQLEQALESDIDEGPIKNQLKTLKIFPGELEEQRSQEDAINDGFRVVQGELVSFYQH